MNREDTFKNGLTSLRNRVSQPKDFNDLLRKLPPITKTFFTYYETGFWSDMFIDFEKIIIEGSSVAHIIKARWTEDVSIHGHAYGDFFAELLQIEDLKKEYNLSLIHI